MSDTIFLHFSTLVNMIHKEASLSNLTIFLEGESNPDENERSVKSAELYERFYIIIHFMYLPVYILKYGIVTLSNL